MVKTSYITSPIVSDPFGRTFKTLRVSLTSVCNLACTYCVDEKFKQEKRVDEDPAALAQMIERLHELLDLEVIRLTGGEPTLYKGLITLVNSLSHLGIPLKLTTNGLLLPKLAGELADAGLKSINVSLDALTETVFERVTRTKGLKHVFAGIDNALQAGLEVKINSVIIKGVNEDQIIPLLEYAQTKGIVIRFLELMRMGHLFSSKFYESFVSEQEILDNIATKFSLTFMGRATSATTKYWSMDNRINFGIISNETDPFCNDCDRLRLDSKGRLYGCLSNNRSIFLTKDMSDSELILKLNEALKHKQPSKFSGSELSMLGIGG